MVIANKTHFPWSVPSWIYSFSPLLDTNWLFKGENACMCVFISPAQLYLASSQCFAPATVLIGPRFVWRNKVQWLLSRKKLFKWPWAAKIKLWRSKCIKGKQHKCGFDCGATNWQTLIELLKYLNRIISTWYKYLHDGFLKIVSSKQLMKMKWMKW